MSRTETKTRSEYHTFGAFRRRSKAIGLGVLLVAIGGAEASGPGILRIKFPETPKVLTYFSGPGIEGEKVRKAMMFQGYFIHFEARGSQFTVFDITNPMAPKRMAQVTGMLGGSVHNVPWAGSFLYVDGQPVDMSNPASPRKVGSGPRMGLWPSICYPYIYQTTTYNKEGASASPLEIFDVSAGAKKVKSIDVMSRVGFATGTAHVIGNLLIVTSGDKYRGISTWDLSNPLEPKLLTVLTRTESMYFSQIYGKWIVLTGPVSKGNVAIYDYSDPRNLKHVWAGQPTRMGDYAHFQNGYMYGGPGGGGGWTKFDLNGFKEAKSGSLGDRMGRHTVPIGNMIYTSNSDFGKRTALVAIDSDPDSKGPSVLHTVPSNGAVNQAVTSRVGILFDEDPDNRTLNKTNVIIRPVGGSALTGTYSGQMGIINFTPSSPLKTNTTYEIVVPKGGVKDWTGNSTGTTFTARFSTGSAVTGGTTAVAEGALFPAPALNGSGFLRDGTPMRLLFDGFRADGRRVVDPSGTLLVPARSE